MGALVRAELLMEVLTRMSVELLAALGWQGTAVVILGALMSRGLRDPGSDADAANDAAARGLGVNVACVATVLLAVMLLGDMG